MEERQREIRESAGLAESRLNVEFIDWLRKWSTPILVVAAVVSLGFFGYRRLVESREARRAEAFGQLEAAALSGNPSPEVLRSIAEEYGDVASIGHRARLMAADTYMQAVWTGVKVGVDLSPTATSDLNPDLTLKDEADRITPDDRDRYLAEAESLYRTVAESTAGDPRLVVLACGAIFGRAAVAESRGDADAARGHYEQVISLAETHGYADYVKIARSRVGDLGSLTRPRIYRADELPKPPPVVVPPPPPPVTRPPQLPIDEPAAGESDPGPLPPGSAG